MKSHIPTIPTTWVLKSPITSLCLEEQIFLMLKWARIRESRSVCLANVHMIMEAYWNQSFARVLESADLVSPDGMPLVWMLRKLGIYNQNRVAGMDVFLNLCELAQQSQISVFFVGSHNAILQKIKKRLEQEFPVLKVAGMEALPFRTLADVIKTEDEELIQKINQSGAGLLFVCLGCPKQEFWISRHQGKIKAVMIGLGAVFPTYAGIYRRAPQYIRELGLEWLYRLFQEPSRLWNRYSQTIPPFVYLALKQIITKPKPFYKLNLTEYAQFLLPSHNTLFNVQSFEPKPSKIGQILIRQNLLTEESLEKALKKQSVYPQLKLGEILLEEGYLSLPELKYHLKNQRIKFGEILVNKKLLLPRKLDKLLQQQKQTNKKLGEIMLEQKLISYEQLRLVLLEQYWRRQGWWLNVKAQETKDQILVDDILAS
ncbi:WecB/TagA/CpsF family glycosyltransferase [Pleurocapsales cyanobacterium LEGE 06147]|nr:WecB/TagA/CpsF family glycosyltransferase [Pleurocapsales cyanobacterium LEGE 06147]